MANFDWIILSLYLFIIAWTGTKLARHQTNTENYFIGGRSIPWWAVGFSFFGTSISTATFIALPGQAYGGDWRPHLANLMLPILVVFIALVVIPIYRKQIKMSAYEFLENRFGYGIRFYASFFYLITRLFRSGFVLFLMGKAIGAMTGWDPYWIILISGLIALVYTIVGGLEAVIWTDVLQSVTLFGGGLICLWILWFGPDGGGQLLQIAHDSDKFRLANWSLNLGEMSIVVTILYGLVGGADGYVVHQDSVQKYLASKTTKQAQKAIWLGAIGSVVTWNVFMLIGSLLYSYYSLHPNELPREIATSETQVFPYFVATHLPKGATGFILAGMCAAAMSSLDTMINGMAMVTVRDLFLHFRPQTSDQIQLKLGRIFSFGWGLLGIAVGLLLLIGVEQALQFSFTVFSILGGGLFGVFLLAFFIPKATTLGVYTGLGFGILISVWALLDEIFSNIDPSLKMGLSNKLIEHLSFPFHPWTTIFFSNLASFAIGWAASILLSKMSKKHTVKLT